MTSSDLLALAVFTMSYAMIAKRMNATVLTAPMLFLGFGFLLSQTGLMAGGTAEHALHVVAEVYADQILVIAINTVWISAVLHGLSALPGAQWYARQVAAMGRCAETRPIETSAKPLVTRNAPDMAGR